MYKIRREKVYSYCIENNIQQMIISDPLNIYYLTGHYIDPDERFLGLLIQPPKTTLFVNILFECHEDTIPIVEFSDYDDPIKLLCNHLTDTILYVDKLFPAKFLIPIIDTVNPQHIQLTDIADQLRMIKDEEEIKRMKESSKLNDLAMEYIDSILIEGLTEKELENKLYQFYIEHGASGFSFPPIISFGKNTSDTHHEPDNTPLCIGDCIMTDIGCKKNMYCSDMTRMHFFGYNPDCFQKHIYNIVIKAYQTGIELCKPGVLLSDIDQAVRNVIIDAGYGDTFKHRTGHMIGLETHDYGEVSLTSNIIAKPGMIFSIEPTIMLEEFTIHHESLVLITENGCELLNTISDSMRIVNCNEVSYEETD